MPPSHGTSGHRPARGTYRRRPLGSISTTAASIPAQRLAALRDRFEALIQDQTENVIVNGAHDNRLPGASSLTFNGVDADALIARLPDLDLSAASACHSGTPEPSHVLRAIGLGDEQAYAILRVVFGRSTTCADMEYAVHRIGETVRVLRAACERTK